MSIPTAKSTCSSCERLSINSSIGERLTDSLKSVTLNCTLLLYKIYLVWSNKWFCKALKAVTAQQGVCINEAVNETVRKFLRKREDFENEYVLLTNIIYVR